MIVLNEAKWAKDVLLGRVDIKNMGEIISVVTRYNHHVLGMNISENFDFTVKWLNVHCQVFSDYKYHAVLDRAVRNAERRPFYNIDAIEITQGEMDKIRSLQNLKYEKIMFVLLCLAKLQKVAMGYDNHYVNCKLNDVYRYARVSELQNCRDETLYRLKEAHCIHFPHKVDSTGFFVDIVDESSDVILRIPELDCQELSYVYLKHTKQGRITRCKECGRLIRDNGKKLLCVNCNERSDRIKTIRCLDCGIEVAVKPNDSKTCRCEECQNIHKRQLTLERVRRYRRNAMSTEKA